ncbi:hypothetical protein WMY93_006592 [Mugilogobius chulae]|uniref:Uncharacterized protein n=1 Tax=Mugilogobius chulae TaxID=88201 RepID=A0AAW0PTW9_9GOBI
MALSAFRMISLNSDLPGTHCDEGPAETPSVTVQQGLSLSTAPGLPAGMRTTEPGVPASAPRGWCAPGDRSTPRSHAEERQAGSSRPCLRQDSRGRKLQRPGDLPGEAGPEGLVLAFQPISV